MSHPYGKFAPVAVARAGRVSASVPFAALLPFGALVGVGIFAVLGATVRMAGAVSWLAFLIAAGVAGLQGYSLPRFGARQPFLFAVKAPLTAAVALAFGEYAGALFFPGHKVWIGVFAVAIIVLDLLWARVRPTQPSDPPSLAVLKGGLHER
jgi:hypothetical protein